ncbi:hypothetical protein COF52_24665 [Bacillus pseudomycoides]|nr:hypothetical protein COF52_24665 [Bacillus pseudomycoides]
MNDLEKKISTKNGMGKEVQVVLLIKSLSMEKKLKKTETHIVFLEKRSSNFKKLDEVERQVLKKKR